MDAKFTKFKMRQRSYNILVILLWLLYLFLTLASPATEAIQRYNISLVKINLLRLTIMIPYLLTWLAALFAALRFGYYSSLVAGSPEAAGYKKITRSLWLLLGVTILPQFLSFIGAFHPASAWAWKLTIILSNYVTLLMYLGAFWYLFLASRILNATNSGKSAGLRLRFVAILALIFVIGSYAMAIFHNQYRTFSTNPYIHPTYYISDWLIILTILIPYVIMWLIGSIAILNIRTYAREVSGVVYRKAFDYVAKGLIVIIALSILLQYLTQAADFLGHASLGIILLIVYFLILAIAYGYWTLAKGARELAAIEET